MTIKFLFLRRKTDNLHSFLSSSDLFLLRAKSPWLWSPWIYSLTANGRKYNENVKKMQNFAKNVIADRERELFSTNDETVNCAKRKPLLDLLLLQMKHDGTIDLEGVREEVDTFMLTVKSIERLKMLTIAKETYL